MHPNLEPPVIDGVASHAPGWALRPQNWIPPEFRRMESKLGWVLCGLLAILGLTATPLILRAWLPVLAAAAAAWWATRRPVGHPLELAVQAALVVGAWSFYSQRAPLGVATAGYLAIAFTYGMLLRSRWSWHMAAMVTLVTVVFGCVFSGGLPSWPGALHVLLGVTGLGAGWLVRCAMWRRRLQRESGCLDLQTGLYNRQGLLVHGDRLLARCHRRGQPATALVFECPDLLEVRAIYGSLVARALVDRLVDHLIQLAAGTGIAARTGPVQFAIVLPGCTRELALADLQSAMGLPCRIEYEQGGNEIVVVPDFIADTLLEHQMAMADWHTSLCRRMAHARDWDQRRRRHQERTRQWFSHPVDVPLPAGAARSPATMPVPVSA